MEITFEQIATILGLTPEELSEVKKAGLVRSGQIACEKAIAEAQRKSDELLAADRKAVEELQAALHERESRHRSAIASLEAMRGEYLTAQRTDAPDCASILALIQ